MPAFTARRALLVATALSGSILIVPEAIGQGVVANGTNSTSTTSASSNQVQGQSAGLAPNTSSKIETIRVRARRLLLREKDSPSAVTELGSNAIQQTGIQGSPASLLRQAPSVNVYQQGIGNSEPVFSIRGIRGLETAQTLDGVPTQDLLYGGGGYLLTGVISGEFDLSQISGVSIYPGVAYPDVNTFGTIGGTIAYDTLRPSADPSVDLLGSAGSFKTFQYGVTLNSGKLDGPLGTGDNAPSVLAQYTNLQTAGYIDYTPARYNNFEFAVDKPYDDGLSKFQFTVLYNTGNGLIETTPVPLAYLQQNGLFSNYNPSQLFNREQNQFATVILKDSTYINDYINVGGSLFYEYANSLDTAYGNPTAFPPTGVNGPDTVDGTNPFVYFVPAGYDFEAYQVPGTVAYEPQVTPYNGNAVYPPGSAGCPTSVANEYATAGLSANPCGYNSYLQDVVTDTYGVQPRITLTLPTTHGIANTIIVGGLIGRETEPTPLVYYGALPTVPQTAANLGEAELGGAVGDGGQYRNIYLVYAQDKVDMLGNTLHVTPGLTLEASDSGVNSSNFFDDAVPGAITQPASVTNSAYCQTPGNACDYGSYSATKWDRELLPFTNVTYDLDKILPAARGTSLYASYGESALFPPVNDFTPNSAGGVPSAAVVHMYEGGVKYNTSNLVLSTDYFYQKVDRDFGFNTIQSGALAGESIYDNLGEREFKGVEASAIWQINRHWQLFGNMSHTLAKYLATNFENSTVQEEQYGLGVRGQPISGIPPWIATFGVDYDRHSILILHDEFHARFEGQFTGPQPITEDIAGDNTNVGTLPYTPPFGTSTYYTVTSGATITDPNTNLPSHVVFNLDLNYSLPVKQLGVGYLKKLDFDVNILNLFNNHYFQYYYNEIAPGTPVKLTSGPPALVGMSSSNYPGNNFAEGIPGEPFAITFTTTARF